MKNHLNILIDANNFLNRTLFTTNFPKKTETLFHEGDDKLFMRKLATDFTSFIRRFKGNYKNIIYCVDSKSWRKTEDELVDAGYKGKRKLRPEINWEKYNEVVNEFAAILEKNGITVVQIENAEADDIIRKYVDIYKALGENSIVWSADNDLTQLIYFNEESFNIQYYQPPKQKNSIMGTASFFDWLDNHGNFEDAVSAEDLLFNLSEHTQNSFNTDILKIMDKNGLKRKVINPHEVLFSKLIGGDSSDSIQKIKAGIGKKTLATAWETFKDEFKMDDCLSDSMLNRMISYFVDIGKIKPEEIDGAKKIIKQNVTLIFLDERVTPEHVNQSFEGIERLFENKVIQHAVIDNMKTLLENTVYFNANNKNEAVPKGMDPFAHMNMPKEKSSKNLF